MALDLYIAYLRAAFHTCFYCCVVTDHLEELQRKCLKHVRKPLSKSLLEEIRAAELEKAEKEQKGEEDQDAKEKEHKRDVSNKDRPNDNRDWKRHGTYIFPNSNCCFLTFFFHR